MSDAQSSTTPEFSDYLAALKRRRMLLMIVALPIIACALALAVGMPDIFVSTGLITFSDATVSGAVPIDKDRVRKDKEYMDEYVDGLAQSVLSPVTIGKLLDQVPGLVPSAESRQDAVSAVIRKTTVNTVKVPVLDPDSGRERQIISAFTVSYASRDPMQAQINGGSVANTSLTGGAGITWTYRITQLVLDGLQGVAPSAAGAVQNHTEVRFRVIRALRPRLSGFVGARAIRLRGTVGGAFAIQGSDYAAATTGLEYQLTRSYRLAGEYDYTWQRFQNEPHAASNAFTLSVIYQPLSRYQPLPELNGLPVGAPQ